jgi:hypothetical protein
MHPSLAPQTWPSQLGTQLPASKPPSPPVAESGEVIAESGVAVAESGDAIAESPEVSGAVEPSLGEASGVPSAGSVPPSPQPAASARAARQQAHTGESTKREASVAWSFGPVIVMVVAAKGQQV